MPDPNKDEKEKATESPLESEQPDNKETPKTYKLRVVSQDTATGRKTREEIEVDEPELLALAQKGYRYEQKAGAMNAEVLKLAKELAEPVAHARALEIMGQMKRDVPEVKQPSAEDLQDPDVLANYLTDIEKRIVGRIENKINETEKQRQEDAVTLKRYNDEIDDACKAFPFVDRQLLIKVIKADQTEIEDVFATAKDLNDSLMASLDIEKIPEEKRKDIVEKHLKKQKHPTAPPEGKAKTSTIKPKTFKELMSAIEKGEV